MAQLGRLYNQEFGQIADPNKIEADLDQIYNYINSGLEEDNLADNAVVTRVIADLAVVTSKLADAAVTSEKIADLAVITSKIANLAVITDKIANLAVTTEKLANSAVTTEKLANSAVTTEKIEDGAVNLNKLNLNDLDRRYYTKEALVPYLRGGDTIIREEVYTIVNPDNGDGTFTYSSYNGQTLIGTLTPEGYQVFTLQTGTYSLNNNRVEVIINDTLRKSVASGGLVEIDERTVALTQPEGAGAEITIRYFERIGVAAEYNIKVSKTKPPLNDGKTMWFELLE